MKNNESCISHVSLGTNNFERAAQFYDTVLTPLGIKRIMEHPGAIAYGRVFPEFCINTALDGAPATVGNGTHLGFMARTKEEVDAFYAVALAQGATNEGAPGPRTEYGEAYYGGSVRDLDGHKIEATYIDMAITARDYGS
jgi:catechol 2,3-dioxygenase-like lactoylglutathione lyase family enzyme